MSRSGYSDDLDNWTLIKWRGQVSSAIRGKRGQQLLRDLAVSLDAMPQKRLIAREFVTADGEACALGVVAQYRGVVITDVDPYDDHHEVAERLNIAHQLMQEIEFMNDEAQERATPEQRWQFMRDWVQKQIVAGETP